MRLHTFISGNWAVYVFNGINTWSPNLCEKSCHIESIWSVWAFNVSAPVHCDSYTSTMASINDFDAVCIAVNLKKRWKISEMEDLNFTWIVLLGGANQIRRRTRIFGNLNRKNILWPGFQYFEEEVRTCPDFEPILLIKNSFSIFLNFFEGIFGFFSEYARVLLGFCLDFARILFESCKNRCSKNV